MSRKVIECSKYGPSISRGRATQDNLLAIIQDGTVTVFLLRTRF